MNSHGLVRRWAEQHGVTIVGRSYGRYTTDTVSADNLTALAEMAVADLRRELDAAIDEIERLKAALARAEALYHHKPAGSEA